MDRFSDFKLDMASQLKPKMTGVAREASSCNAFAIATFSSFTFSAPAILTLTRQPAYTNLTCIPRIYTGYAKMNVVYQGFRKLSYYSQQMCALNSW